AADNESVVGDECHIISGKGHGPRHDPTFPPEHLEEPNNLILLCRVHHKMVDDQYETYTIDVLRTLKTNHEVWVSSTLTEQKPVPPVRVKRVKENIPDNLIRLLSGRSIFEVINGASAFAFDHDELNSEAEVELVGGFLQLAQDYGDLSGELEAGHRVEATFEMGSCLKELEEAGFWVFGGREVRLIEGGVSSSSRFPIAILHVLRTNNPGIFKVDLKNTTEQDLARSPGDLSEN